MLFNNNSLKRSSVIIYGSESRTWREKDRHLQFMDLEIVFESTTDGKKNDQSVLNQIKADCSLEVMISKQKLTYFRHLMGRMMK